MVYFTTTLTVIMASLGQSQAEFYHDFRSGAMHPALSLFGPDATRVARFEPRGLRINLPAKRENSQPVGVSPQFRVAGDFEITATYELLAADPGSFGAGVNLRVMAGAPMREAADLARFRRSKEGDVYLVNRVSVRDADKRDHKTNTFPTTTKAGKVRIQRIGTVLHYLVADDSGTTFRELAEEEFVSDECTVRLVANTGSGPAVDARLVDLRIRADHLPIAATGSARPWVWTRRLLLALLGVAVVGAGIAGFRWWHRRRAAAA